MAGFYEPLSNLDSSFLALETRNTHMHVAGLVLFEAGPLRNEEGGIDVDRVRRHVESKLHLIPKYRMRLAHVPFERHPVWVDDEHFDIEYHVRHASLPRPGDEEQLMTLMGQLTSQQLDRSKPLWEIFVVEGLADDRFALVSKTHHSMIDGVSGVDIMTVLLGLAPDGTVAEPEPFAPRPVPDSTELLIRETARRTGHAMSTMRSLAGLREDAQVVAMHAVRRIRAMGHSLTSGWLTTASDTPLNGKVGPSRRFGTLDLDLAEVKAVKNALGGSVNDVVLATVAGGVRTYLEKGHALPVGDIDFRVMAPVSVRSHDQRGTLGNKVAMWLAALPVGEVDPVVRLEAVRNETRRLKTTDQALGAETLVRMSTGAPATLVSLAVRLAAGARPFNMTVTNVPGPQFPLYLLGSRMLATYPLVPLWEGHGAGIAIFSYSGRLYWGFNADWDLVSDLDVFVDAVAESFAELRAAAEAAAEAPRVAPPASPERAAVTGTEEAEAGGPSPARRRAPKRRPPLSATSTTEVEGSADVS